MYVNMYVCVCVYVCRDGVIEAKIDHERGWLFSHEVTDLYSTDEPQKAFHKCVVVCMYVCMYSMYISSYAMRIIYCPHTYIFIYIPYLIFILLYNIICCAIHTSNGYF